MMLATLAFSLLSLQDALSESSGSQLLAAASLPRNAALEAVGGSKDWRADLQAARAERSGASYTWVWDSSALLPPQQLRAEGPAEYNLSGTKIARIFLREGLRDIQSVPLQSVSKSFKEQVVHELRQEDTWLRDLLSRDDGSFSMKLSPRLVIEGAAGEWFEFALTPSQIPQKASPIKESEKPDMRRVPESLQKALDRQTLLPPSGRLQVQKAVEILRPSTGRLTIDERVLDRDILIVNKRPEAGVGAVEFARVIASSMGMYWREVGLDWHLACSPEHPITRAYELRREKNLHAALQLLAEMSAAGLLPEGVTADQMAEGMISGQLADKKAIISLLAKFGDKARLLSGDPNSLQSLINGSKPLKVRFTVAGTMRYIDPKGNGHGFDFNAP